MKNSAWKLQAQQVPRVREGLSAEVMRWTASLPSTRSKLVLHTQRCSRQVRLKNELTVSRLLHRLAQLRGGATDTVHLHNAVKPSDLLVLVLLVPRVNCATAVDDIDKQVCVVHLVQREAEGSALALLGACLAQRLLPHGLRHPDGPLYRPPDQHRQQSDTVAGHCHFPDDI
eukprot:CAMPEP_0171088562 /NCGR_PEP_ID=MMETSP0766_2-20121228/20854_1 /TAXON_ID=439317 /ORGANISM="Gambierdiscus australes, Strain CAWD 149" /LENGTH=171 /DNA_ID=CAMNT_0011546367 /DNA_START=100 /DNA_END=616 /DNA_ORIENTATION=-